MDRFSGRKIKVCDLENCRGCNYEIKQKSFFSKGMCWAVLGGLVVAVGIYAGLIL